MKVELLLSLDEERLLREEAEKSGLSNEEYITVVVRKDATRLGHVERCRPKGNRPIVVPTSQVRAAVDFLEMCYSRLRELRPNSYESTLKPQENEWREYVAKGNWRAVLEFRERQPWVKKGGQEV